MMQNNDIPAVSIVVPVYNAAAYLRDCVSSILCQSFSDFELLLINDGSSDESGIICEEFRKSDSRIKVFHKENGGATSARRYGVDNALGEWIMFVDSDDTMPNDALDDLRKHDDGHTDIIAGTILYKSRNRIIKTETESKFVNMDYYVHLLLNRKTYYGPCAKLIRKSLFSNIRWNEDPRIFQNEDLLMLVELAAKSSCFVSFCNEHVHYICEDKEGSVSTKHMSYEGWKLLFLDLKSVITSLSSNCTCLFSDYVNYSLWTIYDCLLTQAINVPQDEYILGLIEDSKNAEVVNKCKKVLAYLKSPIQRMLFCKYRKVRLCLKGALVHK